MDEPWAWTDKPETVNSYMQEVTDAVNAIKEFFRNNSPKIDDDKCFLIKEATGHLPPDTTKLIAAYASQDKAPVRIWCG